MKAKINMAAAKELKQVLSRMEKCVDNLSEIQSDLETEIDGDIFSFYDNIINEERTTQIVTLFLDELARSYEDIKGFTFQDEKNASKDGE